MIYIGILGKKGAGKDYFAGALCKELSLKGLYTGHFAFAYPLKKVLSGIVGCPADKFDNREFKERCYFSLTDGFTYDVMGQPAGHDTMSMREMLQDVGQGLKHILGDNIWINATMSKIETAEEDEGLEVAIISDVRYKNEYEALKEKGAIFVRVVNPSLKYYDKHSSENEANDFEVDYTVLNDWQNKNTDVDTVLQQIIERLGYSEVLPDSSQRT
jgi:hypothetical protein